MSKPFDLNLFNEVYARVEAEEVRRLMGEAINKDKSPDDVRRDFLFARVPGSNSYNKETADDFKNKIKEAQARQTQGLEAKKEQAPDNDVFGNLWGGVSGLAGAAGDALDAEKKRVEDAIKKHTQTGANQQQVTKTAAERTRLLRDAVARELWEKRENQESEGEPLLRLSRTSSGSDASSTSGSSGSNKSTTTRGTEESGVSALKTLTNQERKTQGPQNGPFASPPSASVSKGSESEGDKKNQSASWEAVKNRFSKCQTYLRYAGSGLYKVGEFLCWPVKAFIYEPIAFGWKSATNNHDYQPQATEPEKQKNKQPTVEESPTVFFGSVRNALRSGVKSLREKLPEYPENIVLAAYQENKNTKRWGWRKMVEVPIPDAGRREEIMSAVGQGTKNLGDGLVTVGATTVGVVFVGAKYASGITLEDVTPGEKAKFAAGVAVGVVGAGFSAASAIRPPNLRAVRGALPSGSDVASALSSFRDSLPSRNDFRGMEIKPPDVRGWAAKVKSNTPSLETMGKVGGGMGKVASKIYQSGPTIPRAIPGGWLEGR